MMAAQKLYVVTDALGGPTKIGISGDPEQRCRHLRYLTKNASLYVAHVAEAGPLRAGLVERKAHQILDDVRVGGEWFRCDVEQAIQAIDIALQTSDLPPVTPTARVSLVLESSLVDELKTCASADSRTVSSYLAVLVERHLKERRK